MTYDAWKEDDDRYGRELDRREEMEREEIIFNDPLTSAVNQWLDAQREKFQQKEAA